ncbi:sensor histidine kinase [Granulicoccus sp. GXG6511]|uniref:sensor histidine kinase n=1 Tax=Granulicoccus sp. GXG6511 TaxID=3381351 RepID=UPI003D7EC5CB
MKLMQDSPVISARRFELYVRWSLYLLMAYLLVQMAGLTLGASSNRFTFLGSLALLALSVVVTVFNIKAARHSLDRVMRDRPALSARFIVGWVAAVAAVTMGTFWLLWEIPGAIVLAIAPAACSIAAVSPTFTIRTAAVVSLAAVVVGGVVTFLGIPQTIAALILLLVFIWSAWSSGWMLRVLRQLQEANETAAELSVAEERLRISRDLHDVFGRTLATISVKAELAAELSRRGHHERAADEMAQVRQIANTAGAEVRRVVRGERRAGWADEIEGARALLSSAGIRCVIAGEEIPERYAETLAWVIREGVTNVLRHSRATQVSITTAVEADEVALTLTNDGASGPSNAASTGTGIASMTQRLQEVGGSLEHELDGDWFLLTASIPVSQEVPA